MKSFIEKAKNESEIQICQSITEIINKLSSQQLREIDINIEQYINNILLNEIQKFHHKANSFFPNLKDVSQTKELYMSKIEILNTFIKTNIQEKLNSKMISCPPFPKNIPELLKEQNINKLNPDTKYILYLNKKPYEIISRKDGKISLPNIKAILNYRHEELPCWRNRGGLVYDDSYTTNIDNWFDPDAQLLILANSNVSQNNWSEGGHRTFFGGGKPPRPQQSKTTISIHVCNPWNIKSFNKSGNVSVSLSNNNSDMFVSGSGGYVHNIKLEIKQ